MLDIDYFKNYNDQFGHIAGDIVLKRVASVLRSFLDVNISLSCRFGGEEFLFYLTDSTKEDAIKTAELLRKKIEEEKIILRRQDTSVTVSIGMAFFPDGTTTSEDLIKLVDQRMYKAKSQGRNQICFT
jgi:diguanylate cyclase (GGDEF)-like protein